MLYTDGPPKPPRPPPQLLQAMGFARGRFETSVLGAIGELLGKYARTSRHVQTRERLPRSMRRLGDMRAVRIHR